MSSLGRIRKNLRNPDRLDPPLESVIDPMISEIIDWARAEDGLTTKVPPHPSKYPDHKNREKGSVFGGVCNRTACNSYPALYYNRGTYGYYCVPCAHGVNGRDPKPLCVQVDHDLTHEEMNEHYMEMHR